MLIISYVFFQFFLLEICSPTKIIHKEAIAAVFELVFCLSSVIQVCHYFECIYNIYLPQITGGLSVIDFCLLTLGLMTTLFVLSSMFLELIDHSIDLDLDLNLINCY